jgi:transcriptional regulator NrdR family protein
MQLKVVKTDGTVEEYLHTKVVGTISNALAAIGESDILIVEQLAEAVTYFLYHKQKPLVVSSNEIFSIIEAVFTVTGYEHAAVVLSEHHFERKLKRSRIEVVCVDVYELTDAEALCAAEKSVGRYRWDKSRIVNDLVTEHDVCWQTARVIASMVEEQIFSMGVTLVPASLVKQLVLRDAAVVLRAERQLQTV